VFFVTTMHGAITFRFPLDPLPILPLLKLEPERGVLLEGDEKEGGERRDRRDEQPDLD
jgi:hypothetical protein